MKKKMFRKSLLLLIISLFTINSTFAFENIYRPSSSLNLINYAKNLTLSVIDTNFRGSWVVDPDATDIKTKQVLRNFNSLLKVKISNTKLEVKKVLGTPSEIKLNGRLWIYGQINENGTYKALTQVFFNEKGENVIGILSLNQKNAFENFGVSIGDAIDKIITVYGEPVEEQDFFEDQDNKEHLGMYYLYPKSGIGFFIGQNSTSKYPTVHGVLVFGNGQ